MGDEVIAFFLPFVAGPGHALRAVEAARSLFGAVGYGSEAGGLPLGAGVLTGRSFVGFISRGLDNEFTAFGDTERDDVPKTDLRDAGGGMARSLTGLNTLDVSGPRSTRRSCSLTFVAPVSSRGTSARWTSRT